MFKKIFFLAAFCLLAAGVSAKRYRAIITTEYGKIEIELYNQTPKHTANFVKLAKKHFYDSTLFHRVIPGFMIQGGDTDSKTARAGQMLGNGDVGYRIPAEFNPSLIHKRGALAMARDNNPEKASSGCQFYIVTGKKFTEEELKAVEKRNGQHYTSEQMKTYETIGGAPHLDGSYTVFGEVIRGMDAVDKIVNQERDKMNRPLKDQRILKLRVRHKFLFFWI
jgi:peptidyl-prolyl cis-trans isomerase B (cyclophilin B)